LNSYWILPQNCIDLAQLWRNCLSCTTSC